MGDWVGLGGDSQGWGESGSGTEGAGMGSGANHQILPIIFGNAFRRPGFLGRFPSGRGVLCHPGLKEGSRKWKPGVSSSKRFFSGALISRVDVVGRTPFW